MSDIDLKVKSDVHPPCTAAWRDDPRYVQRRTFNSLQNLSSYTVHILRHGTVCSTGGLGFLWCLSMFAESDWLSVFFGNDKLEAKLQH